MSESCQSCSMTIESGTYCQYCSDDHGNLIPFEECFERMVKWTFEHGEATSRQQAEKDTLKYMSTMPAWKNHPQVQAAHNAGS